MKKQSCPIHCIQCCLSVYKLESGADVRFNPRLDKLIEKAKSISMPKQSIENAIKTGAGVS